MVIHLYRELLGLLTGGRKEVRRVEEGSTVQQKEVCGHVAHVPIFVVVVRLIDPREEGEDVGDERPLP